MPASAASATARRRLSSECCTTPGIDAIGVRLARALAHEQRQDQLGRVHAGLGDEPAHRRGAAQAARADAGRPVGGGSSGLQRRQPALLGELSRPSLVRAQRRQCHQSGHERGRRAVLGDDVHGEAGGARVEGGARSDAGDDASRPAGGASCACDLPGDAAGGDQHGADAAGRDIRGHLVGDRHADRAVGGDELDLEAELRRARRPASARRCRTAG